MLFCCNKLRFWLKHHEVGIESFRNAALARFTSGEACWTLRHPPHDIRKRETAGSGFRPDHRQCQRETRNPAQRHSKVSFAQSLHLRRAWRMICRYQIDHSLSKSLPEFFAILPAADRRRALEQRLAVWNLLRREMQIMRTSFHAHWQAFRFRCAQHIQRLARGQMYNVQTK